MTVFKLRTKFWTSQFRLFRRYIYRTRTDCYNYLALTCPLHTGNESNTEYRILSPSTFVDYRSTHSSHCSTINVEGSHIPCRRGNWQHTNLAMPVAKYSTFKTM